MNSDGHCANIMAGGISTMGIGFVADQYVDDSNASGGGTDWGRLWTMTTGRWGPAALTRTAMVWG